MAPIIGHESRGSSQADFYDKSGAEPVVCTEKRASMKRKAAEASTSTSAGGKKTILVVSNRLPLTISKSGAGYTSKMSSGGLVTALSGVKKLMKFTWIGWPGW